VTTIHHRTLSSVPKILLVVQQMYATVEAPVIVVKPAVAEMVKYVANTWHAAKVTLLTNGGLPAFRVDGGEVMNIIVQDTKPNVSCLHAPSLLMGVPVAKDLSALLTTHENGCSIPPKYGSSYQQPSS